MQSRLFTFILFPLLLLTALPAVADEEPLRAIRRLSDEVYRLSQEMITHGSEGHTHEIVKYGREMIERTETLIRKVESSPPPVFNGKKEKIIASLKATLNQAKEAVRLGEAEKSGPALDASRKTSFRAKQSRQQLQSLK